MKDYQVVFEYTDGPSVGGRFICHYESKEALEEALLKDCPGNKVMKVIAEGVSDEEALRLCDEREDIAKDHMQREFMKVFNCYIDEQLDTFKQTLEDGNFSMEEISGMIDDLEEAAKSSPEDLPSVMEKVLEECGIE